MVTIERAQRQRLPARLFVLKGPINQRLTGALKGRWDGDAAPLTDRLEAFSGVSTFGLIRRGGGRAKEGPKRKNSRHTGGIS